MESAFNCDTGHRGTDKTTLFLKKMHHENGVYLSLDDFYFETNRLIQLVHELYLNGLRALYLDEIHCYEYWSKDLKQLTDDYPDLKIVLENGNRIPLWMFGFLY